MHDILDIFTPSSRFYNPQAYLLLVLTNDPKNIYTVPWKRPTNKLQVYTHTCVAYHRKIDRATQLDLPRSKGDTAHYQHQDQEESFQFLGTQPIR